MKRKITILAGMVLFFLINTTKVYAGPSFTYSIPNPSRYNSLEEIISAASSLIQPVFILTFGGFVLYGGWVRLTSKGEPDKIASSSKIIMAAATGFAIAVLAPSIVNIVTGALGVTGFDTLGS